MKIIFLDDLIKPLENILTKWNESGLIWAIVIGGVLVILWFMVFK